MADNDAGEIEYLVLGPIEVRRAGRPVPLGAAMLRRVLALLLRQPGQPVSAECLIDALWDGVPPPSARKTLQVYMRRLRQAVGDDGVVLRPAGYVLPVRPDQVDALRFDALVVRGLDARRRGALEESADLLNAALGLWRGEPYADVVGEALAGEARRLTEQRLLAQEEYIEVRLDLGRHSELVPELAVLTAANPFRERLTAGQMLALCRAGRQVEALEVYRHCAALLADELGVEPGPALSWLHLAILRDDPIITRLRTADLDRIRREAETGPVAKAPAEPPPAETIDPSGPVPRQLPADMAKFVGRRGTLKELEAAATSADDGHGRAPAVIVISGTAGVGKTALAVHWAHRIADRFTAGQLYVNLRGFDPANAVLDPAEAIHRFLEALDVPPARIPTDLDAQAALYRTLLADRRILVVLDNARDAEQVRPLLPGAPGCLVVVTSRNHLASLVATDGAHPIALDLLPPAEARDLLARRLGGERTEAEAEAVDEIITRCARLPLALAIAAARAATHPTFPLRALAAELRDTRDRLDVLTCDDSATDVRALLSWSYQTLTPDAARLFRLLGLHPGPDISAPAAASLSGRPLPATRALLAELARAHLIAERPAGRYAFHDLLRAYATEQARITEPDERYRAAIHRVLDHFLHTACAADRVLSPNRDPLRLAPPQPGVTPERPADQEQALAWFSHEHPVLLDAIGQAAGEGLETHVWQLAWSLVTFLDRQGHWHDWVATQRAALAAARRLGDPLAQAQAHRLLALAENSLGRPDAAYTHLQQALDLDRQAGDQLGQAYTHDNLGRLRERQGRHAEALDHVRQARDLFREAGNFDGHARALNNMGWLHIHLGDYEQALTYCQQALTLHQRHGNRYGQAHAWDSIGYAHQSLGSIARAITCYQHAIELFREGGDRFFEADVLARRASARRAGGDDAAARDDYRQALAILDELGHPDADDVRAKLAALALG